MLLSAIRRLPAPIRNGDSSDDAEVQELAYKYLSRHTHFRGHLKSITIVVREGALLLEGQLPSFYLKQVLQTALRDVPGVCKITNQIDVVSPYGLSSVKQPFQENCDE